MTESIPAPSLALEPVEGPPLSTVRFDPTKHTAIGRSSVCQVVLPDESVSRRHATIHQLSGTWFITDTEAKHGTFVNGVRLDARGVAPLKQDDLVGIGPWSFRVSFGRGTGTERRIAEDTLVAKQRVEKVSDRELAAITQNRLNILMNTAAAIAGVGDETSLANIILPSALEGSGFPRATLLRESGQPGEVQIIGERTVPGVSTKGSTFSRSLLAAARSGEVARLTEDAPLRAVESIMKLGIQTALCAPVFVGSAVSAFLYLDARVGEEGSTFSTAKINYDAAAFCQAMARMCGMALGNINRLELERRQREFLLEMEAAREAQRMILPPETGTLGGMTYAVRVLSGRFVAGDLFDVVPLPDGRIAAFLGDVSGKGISAAVLMAAAQTHLGVTLRATGDAALAAKEVNRYVCAHTSDNKFITLWIGVFDPRDRSIRYVDAGHGHWLVKSPGKRPQPVQCAGGIPLGIDDSFEYQCESTTLEPGSRVIVFSDGVVEQPGSEGTQFGIERAIEALQSADAPKADVSSLFSAVIKHAGTDSLADDTTVASISLE